MVAPKQPKPGDSVKVDVGGGERRAVPGKVTQVDQQYGTGNWELELDTGQHILCTPSMTACLVAPPRLRNTYLDPLLSMSHEEVERLIEQRIAEGKQQVCGTLPQGGVFFGTRDAYQRAVGIDNMQIQMRTLQNMETSALASVQGAIMKLQGQDNARIMHATDAMVLLTGMLGSAIAPRRESNNRPTEKAKERRAQVKQEPPKSAKAVKPPAPPEREAVPETEPRNGPSEVEPIPLHPKPRTPTVKTARTPIQRPVYPTTKTGPAPGEKRREKLKTDLKRRSVPTRVDGKTNPDFDVETPNHIVEHFKAEQARTQSNNPKKWLNPPGYEALHPNGRRFADYGEPSGTRLHWGTFEDNRMQGAREDGATPRVEPKPLPP